MVLLYSFRNKCLLFFVHAFILLAEKCILDLFPPIRYTEYN